MADGTIGALLRVIMAAGWGLAQEPCYAVSPRAVVEGGGFAPDVYQVVLVASRADIYCQDSEPSPMQCPCTRGAR